MGTTVTMEQVGGGGTRRVRIPSEEAKGRAPGPGIEETWGRSGQAPSHALDLSLAAFLETRL